MLQTVCMKCFLPCCQAVEQLMRVRLIVSDKSAKSEIMTMSTVFFYVIGT